MEQTIENNGAELVSQICPECCIVYAIQRSVRAIKFGNGGSWYCPNGHELVYQETESEKLKKELTAEANRYESLRRHSQDKSSEIELLRRSIASLKGQITKLKGAAK